MSYRNDNTINYEYDIFDRTTKETYNSGSNNSVTHNYAYDASGALAKQYSTNSSDTVLEEYRYEYDSLGRLIRSSEYNNNAFTQRTEHIYDESDRLTSQTWYNGSGATSQTYTYSDTTGLLTELETSYPGNTQNTKIAYSYNALNMLSGKTVSAGGSTLYSTSYTYNTFQAKPQRKGTTNQVSKLSYNDSLSSLSRQYTYDGNGNIASEKNISGSVLYSYTYDDQNQLTQAVYPDGTTYSYEYDTVGNIRSKKINNGTPIYYTYGDSKWADLLTAYDGTQIKYDNVGNPTKYYNGKTWNMEWSKGRELSRITRGSKTWDFTYDMAGVRSGKTVTTRDASTGEITGTTEYKYTTLSGKLVRVEYNTTVLDIVYDESGNPFSIRYKSNPTKEGVVYYYVLNVQGDVVGLLNSSGELVVEYKYDPWGKLLETKIGVDESNAKYDTYNNMALRNPLRYRGYIYDRDTGLYYLQSRYYDPAIGRFINADTYTTTDETGLLSTNMFAYCENNPVIGVDYSGDIFETIFDVITLGASVVEVIDNPSDPWAWGGLLGDAIDLIPFVCGVGESVRGIKTTKKIVDESKNIVKTTVKSSTKQIEKRTFRELIADINKHPDRWKMTSEKISKSTKKGNKGGTSIERTYYCEETEEYIYQHILKNKSGRIIDQHYRPYGK